MSLRDDYVPAEIAAARAVLNELVELFQDQEGIVLVGGWVPALILSSPADPHVGSLDVDLAFRNPSSDIDDRLRAAGYFKHPVEPQRYFKDVGDISVPVDILAPIGLPKRHTKGVALREFRPFVVAACELAFTTPSAGTFENETSNRSIPIASMVSFIVMKAVAMSGRTNEKDAYDIYYVLKHHAGGAKSLAEEFKEIADEPEAQRAIEILRRMFETLRSRGPRDVAQFYDDADDAVVIRDAYERVQHFLSLV